MRVTVHVVIENLAPGSWSHPRPPAGIISPRIIDGGAPEVLALADIISSNVAEIHRLYSAANTAYPTLGEPYNASSPGERLTLQPEVLRAAMLATSAAAQIIACLRLPGLALLDRAFAFHVPAALRIATETCSAEILREAGPGGMEAKAVAAKCGVEPNIVARTLRLLASHYVFKEVAPNVFANNRISSLLDTGKESTVILKDAQVRGRTQVCLERGIPDLPGDKHTNTDGIPAMVEHYTEEIFKSSTYWPDVVLSGDFRKTAFQRAFAYEGRTWEARKNRPGRLHRFQMAMLGISNANLHNRMREDEGFDWDMLPGGALVVDVGGGNGSAMWEIAQRSPHLRMVIEDREETVGPVAGAYWNNDPARKRLLDAGNVTLQSQDFFEPQASLPGAVAIFHLRHILHDWNFDDSLKILQQLHATAAPGTKLMLVEQVVPYACPTPTELEFVKGRSVPAPLLANLGEARADVYSDDFAMGAQHGAQERTIGEFKELTEAAGWRIERVYQPVAGVFSQIVCAKV